MDERKVLISRDGFGRMAIVRRPDGLFCLYEHWCWTIEAQETLRIHPVEDRRWDHYAYDRQAIYEDKEPRSGLFGSVEEAEQEARGIETFSDAEVEQPL